MHFSQCCFQYSGTGQKPVHKVGGEGDPGISGNFRLQGHGKWDAGKSIRYSGIYPMKQGHLML